MSSLHSPADMPIPELDAIIVQRNKEDWLLDVEDDMPGKIRTVCLLAKCPFEERPVDSCTVRHSISWARAQCWSLESPEHVIGYLLHHAINSSFHFLGLREAYDILVSKWADLEWISYEDTFEDRAACRALVARNKRRRVGG